MTADFDLCEASAVLRVRDMEAMLCLNEAAIAWRAGNTSVAGELAARARRAWSALGEVSSGALLAAALELAATGGKTQEDADTLARRALACPIANIALPALGLLAMAGPATSIDDAALEKLARQEDPATWDQRLEVISIREALDAINARRPSPP